MKSEAVNAAFEEFHDQHPDVYDQLVELARTLRVRGFDHYGMRGLFEVVRFHRSTSGKDASGFKLNNSYTPYYSRLIMEREPDLDGMFHVRGGW